MNVQTSTIEELHSGLKNKEYSSQEITKTYLDHIAKHDESIDAFLEIDEKKSLEQAAKADAMIQTGEYSPLCGIPCAIKDNFCVKDWHATAASKILEGYMPPYDATCVAKLKKEGMVTIGKVNTDEFTMGTTNEFSAYKKTKNPFDTTRVPGGSSGGPAAAVSTGFAPYALGTDTGGSIRLPASFCGITGLKNTYGLVSRYGVMSMASSLDTIGPMTKTAKDAAIVLQSIAGKDDMDATTSPKPIPNYLENIDASVSGMTIGLPKEYFADGVDPRIKESVEKAVEVYKSIGMNVKEVSLPHTDYALAVYYVICPAEVSSNMSRYDGIRFGPGVEGVEDIHEYYLKARTQGFGPEVKRRIMIGTYVLSSGYYDAYYKKAQKVRTLIGQDFKNVFDEVDVIIAPSAPMLPFTLGEKLDDPLAMYLADVFTVSANVSGIPGISIPCGFAKEGEKELPIGMQIFGNQFEEAKVLQVAHAFQTQTTFHKKTPNLQ